MSQLTVTCLPTYPTPTTSASKNCHHHNSTIPSVVHSLFSPSPCCFAWVLLPPALDSLTILTLVGLLSLFPRLPFLVHLLYSRTLPYNRVPRPNRPRASLSPSSRLRTLVLGLETTHSPSQKLSWHLAPPYGIGGGEGRKPRFVPRKLVDKRVTNIPVGRLHSELPSPLRGHR